MNRDKVLELAQRADELARHFAFEVPFEVYRLERFAALIEAEVRGDAEPVGYTNEGYKGMQYANAEAYKDIRPDFIERNKLTAPLYKHPTPAVVRQLVEALEETLPAYKESMNAQGIAGSSVAWNAEAALDAAKEAGL